MPLSAKISSITSSVVKYLGAHAAWLEAMFEETLLEAKFEYNTQIYWKSYSNTLCLMRATTWFLIQQPALGIKAYLKDVYKVRGR